MANPTPYTPGYSYSDWQASNPSKPLPADEVDNDFANIERSVNETISALKDIRRSDGKLNNGIVTPDSLSPTLSIGFTFEGSWVEGAAYTAGDGVVYENAFYSARQTHTSSVANAPGNTTFWNYLFSVEDIVTAGALSMPRDAFVGDGITKDFTLSFYPVAARNLLVMVGGVMQAVDQYTVTGNVLTFVTTPRAGYAIEVRGFSTLADGMVPNNTDEVAEGATNLYYTPARVEAVITGQKGAANGIAPLDGSGRVPAVNLPSYVDDVLEFANLGAFPATGSTGVIYIALDTNKVYRWSGSTYVEISPAPGTTDAVPEGTTNLYHTAQRVRDAVLTGLSTAVSTAVTAADSVLSAIGKLQAQLATKAPSNGAALTGTTTATALKMLAQGGAEGGEIVLAKSTEQTSVSGDLHIDYVGNYMRMYENGGSFRQFVFDYSTGLITFDTPGQGNFPYTGLTTRFYSGNFGAVNINNVHEGIARVDGGALGGAGIINGPIPGTLNTQLLTVGDAGRGFQIGQTYSTVDPLFWRTGIDGYQQWRAIHDSVSMPTTAFGKGIVNVADAAAARAYIGVSEGGSGVAGVTTFNGRAGNVVPQAGDYSAAQVARGADNVDAAITRVEVKTPWYTPEMFGAVGDNSTDDLAAFNNMLAAIGSRGGRILLPPKRYFLSGTLTFLNKAFMVEGVKSYGGGNGTVIRFAANAGLILANADATVLKSFRMEDGGGSTSGQLLGIGQFTGADGTYGADFENLEIVGGYRNMWVQNSAYTRLRHCRFAGAYGREAVNICDGPDSTHGVDAVEFEQCVITGGSSAVDCVRMNGKAHSVKFSQTGILFGNVGLRLMNNTGGSNPKFLYFSDGGFENGNSHCVYVEEGDDLKFNNMYASNDGTGDGFHMAASMDGMLKISDSTIRGCGRDGIRYLGGRLRAFDNDIINNGARVTGDGVRIGAGVSGFKVNDNYIGGGPDGINNQRYGIYNDAAAGAGTIQGNTIQGNVTAPIGGATTSGSGISNNLT